MYSERIIDIRDFYDFVAQRCPASTTCPLIATASRMYAKKIERLALTLHNAIPQ